MSPATQDLGVSVQRRQRFQKRQCREEPYSAALGHLRSSVAGHGELHRILRINGRKSKKAISVKAFPTLTRSLSITHPHIKNYL